MDRVEARLVLGTAGHIDHGKTALIRALTGVETDRLPEEKARGITIDLGFAPLDLPDGRRVSIVDVPGHEGLVRTMVSGASGIDMVVLVVAADEGVMPQTREHVAICELLGIDRGVVALTKIDNTGPELAELAGEEVADLLETTSLAGARILPVSSLTGDGIDELRAAIGESISGAEPRTPRTGPPRLSIDRSFAAKGFGCVVTGTLTGGSFSVGDEIEIQPTGRRCRIRGLQSHGASVESCPPGLRCAVNLQGVELDEVSRGQVISTPGAIEPTVTADVKLWWLDAAPAIEDQAAIEFLAGTAERRARLAPIGDPELQPGAIGYARLHIDGEAVPLVPGDRFIARGFARNDMGGSTVGGGSVLDVAPLHRRRNDPALHADLALLSAGNPEDALLVRIRRAGLSGIDGDRLRRQVGLDASTYDQAMASVCASDQVAETSSHRLLHRDSLERLERRLLATLAAYHTAEPIRPGMPTGALRGSLPDNVSRDTAERVVGRLRERGALVIEADCGRLPEFSPKLGPKDEVIVARMIDEARAAALEPPSLKDWSDRHGVGADHFGNLLAYLVRNARLVRAPGDFWFDSEAVDSLREKVAAHIREHGRLETPDYKALIGTTRRTAVPLMELFDQEHFTVRSGDARVLRRG
ncbi:MAG: selenocysteine-specific translation elongation factor [Myxococcota bacterium]